MSEAVGESAPHPLATRSNKRRSSLRFLRDLLIILLVAIVVSFFVKTFLVRSFYIPSGSMKNTLQINDRIVVNELQPSLFPLEHGDVVVFKDPGGWLEPSPPAEGSAVGNVANAVLTFIGFGTSDSNEHLIKRVIGLPGDRVVCCNPIGQLEVNGFPLDEPYILLPDGAVTSGAIPFDITVPNNSLWVMGDNRYNSQDSSKNQNLPGKGFVPLDDVVGRAFVITWPTSRWSWLDDYPLTFGALN